MKKTYVISCNDTPKMVVDDRQEAERQKSQLADCHFQRHRQNWPTRDDYDWAVIWHIDEVELLEFPEAVCWMILGMACGAALSIGIYWLGVLTARLF